MGWPWPRETVDDVRLKLILAQVHVIRFDQLELKQELKAMSDTLAAELAAERAALDNLKAGVAAVAQRVSDLAAQLAATATGSGPTEAQLAEMAADAKEIQGAADALKAAAAPAAEA